MIKPNLNRNHQLKNDLKKYSSMVGALVGMTALAQGQVVYVDINPDVVLSGGDSLLIDFNQDGTKDLSIVQDRSSSGTSFIINYIYASGRNGGQVVGYNKLLQGYNYTFASALNNNAAINQNDNWYGTGAFGIDGVSSGNALNYGEWGGKNNKYLGIRFTISGQYHYGWVRLDVKNDYTEAIVKDYAYDSIPGAEISAGAGGNNVGIGGIQDLKGAQAYSFGKSLFVSFKNPESDFTIEVHNMMGEKVYAAGLAGSRHEIRLNDLPAGMYVVEINSEGKTFRKKFHLN